MNKYCKSFVYVPTVFLFLMAGGFFICYGIAVSSNHVVQPPRWPYVSDTGAYPPESCIFTLFLTWSAFSVFITMVLYYKYVNHYGNGSKCNLASLIIGGIITFGITLVGAFQWTNVLIPHLIGAFMAFVGAVVYSWMIVYISWRHMTVNVHGMSIVYVRIVLAILETVSLLVPLSVVVAGLILNTANVYNLSTISEWCLIYCAVFFLATMMYDLRKIRRAEMKLILQDGVAETSLQPTELTRIP